MLDIAQCAVLFGDRYLGSRAIYLNYGIYLKSTIYFRYGRYDLPIMIVPRLDKVLAKEKRTFYWLAKETGVSHTTLWRLKKGKAVGINFETLEKICYALRCQPGDVLFLTKDKTPQRHQALKKGRKS
jgi:putative transcriptional regulator